MLQLEKIKTTIENNEKRIEYRKDGHKLDFFKTSNFIRPKKNKILKFIVNIFLLWVASLYWNAYLVYAESNKKVLDNQKVMQIYSSITESIDTNNTIDIAQFESLTKTPSGYGSLMSNVIIQKILWRERNYKNNKDFMPELYTNYQKLNPQVTEQVFKIYSQNWNYGLEREKQVHSDCGINSICHYVNYASAPYYKKINDMGLKSLAYVRYPEIFQKEIELMDLQNKYQTYIK